MKEITKRYGQIVANDRVDIALNQSEILAIVGENGAGKSTLMKILYGLERPDHGEILLNGESLHFKNPSDAMKRGIGMVQQHFMLFPSMTVTENIIYNNEIHKGIFLNKAANRARVKELSEQYALQVAPDAVAADCPVGTQQRVEILKTLYQNADIIIFDEPSAVLTPIEVTDLLKTLKRLAKMGKTIILITHKLNEVMQVSDHVLVMRDGKVVARTQKGNTSIEELSYHMVGRQIKMPIIDPMKTISGLLEVDGLTLSDGNGQYHLKEVSFHVNYGEIVGIAGVSGNGQAELVRCVTGLERADSGSIRLSGKELAGKTVQEFRETGVAHIPEDRYLWGSAPGATLSENALMGSQRKSGLSKRGILNLKKVHANTAGLIREYSVKAANVHQKMRELSGGNAQKLIVAREISHETPLLVASEPTRGVDIGAMEFIHNRLLEKRAKGDGILLISSELSEIMKLSDRIYVIYGGKLCGEFTRNNASERELGLLMLGGKFNGK